MGQVSRRPLRQQEGRRAKDHLVEGDVHDVKVDGVVGDRQVAWPPPSPAVLNLHWDGDASRQLRDCDPQLHVSHGHDRDRGEPGDDPSRRRVSKLLVPGPKGFLVSEPRLSRGHRRTEPPCRSGELGVFQVRWRRSQCVVAPNEVAQRQASHGRGDPVERALGHD